MHPFPITQRIVTDRIDRYRDASIRHGLVLGRVRRPVRPEPGDR